MTIFWHELKRGRLPLLIWAAAIASMMAIAVLLYPEMAPQMSEMEEMMANMGSLSDAFGMDSLQFGNFIDYFAMECGSVMGLGGAIFAAITGFAILGKEEREHTAEFLYTHPLSRTRILLEKLLALAAQIILLNLIVAVVTVGAIALIGEEVDVGVLCLLLLSYLLLELEIAQLCFGISSFLHGGGLGIGLGLAIGMYFLNLLANIAEEAKWLKYLTPFAYTEGADIVKEHALNTTYLLIGAGLTAAVLIAAFLRFRKKDLC